MIAIHEGRAQSAKIPSQPASVSVALILGALQLSVLAGHAFLTVYSTPAAPDIWMLKSFALGFLFIIFLPNAMIAGLLLFNIGFGRDDARWGFAVYAVLIVGHSWFVFFDPTDKPPYHSAVSVFIFSSEITALSRAILLLASLILLFLPASNRWFKANSK